MSFYDEMEDVVIELLSEFGQPISITHIPEQFNYNTLTSGTTD